MQPASEHHIPDGLLASMTLLSEKPRHGVAGRKSALQSGIDEANSTAAIGLRCRCWEIASDPVDAPNKACSVQPATSFMQTHAADAATLANELNVPTNYVLAVAGNESAYGTSNIAIGANNYFGLHAGAPGSIGPWSGNPIVAAFAPSGGFMASGQSFFQLASPLLNGLSSPISPTSFFTALHAKWGIETPNYVQNMVQSANMAQIRMNCP